MLGPTRIKEKTDRWKIALKTFQCLHKTSSSFTEVIKAAQGDKEILEGIEDFIFSGERAHSCNVLKDYLDNHIHDCYIADMESTNKDTTTSFKMFDTKTKHSAIEILAKAFPKIKTKVTSLKDEHTEETEDPTEMAKITKRYWSKHFGKKKLKVRIGRFLSRHYKDKRIKIEPREITLEIVESIILECGSTAPGPDNIPFKAYRILVEEATPIFMGVIKLLMKGTLPPEGFNNAIFHLLPKKGTGYVEDTRPLSVSNTYNRIIASIFKEILQEPLLSFLDRDQSGFWPNRSMEENLDYFNEAFYSALDKKEEYSLFLFDIAKAFDSVSHESLHALLRHVGIPKNLCNAIKGLFHKISLTTNYKGGTNQVFEVLSGIKQGCPLSPLLFIVVMDVLRQLLKTHSTAAAKMFADDTAAGDSDIVPQIPGISKAFKLFERATNLKLNLNKTPLLTTLAPSERGKLRKALDANGWGKVTIKEEAIYLGIPFGRPPFAQLGTAYYDRLNTFRGRMVRYSAHKSTLSIQKRISLINVFALTLLSYPFKFYLIPSNYGENIASDVDGLLARFQSFKTMAYQSTTAELGFSSGTMLQDYWIQNLAALASRTTMEQIQNHPTTTKYIYSRGKKRVTYPTYTWSMRFLTNRAIAVKRMETLYNLKQESFVGKHQTTIYKLIISSPPYRQAVIEYHSF